MAGAVRAATTARHVIEMTTDADVRCHSMVEAPCSTERTGIMMRGSKE